jgi:hypothetical protein
MADLRDLWRDGLRETVLASVFFLPQTRRTRLNRWLRGREEARKVDLADVCFMSIGKSGRTWLRLMVSRFYQLRYGVPEGTLLEFDNLHRRDARLPRVFWSHSNYIRDYTGHWDDKRDFYGKRVLLLARDPRDIAVSQYHQWQHRMRPVKKLINDYPPHGADVSLWDFVLSPSVGLPAILAWMQLWERELPKCAASEVVRYEDMRADPEDALARTLAFLGTPGDAEAIREAVAYAAYDNMKKIEQDHVFRGSGNRLLPGDRANPDSYKVRRAKVGGYRDDFTPEQVAELDALVVATTPPLFGYNAERARRAAQV